MYRVQQWCLAIISIIFQNNANQGREHLKLGGAGHFERIFFFKKKGALFRNRKGTSLFMANLGGHVPPVPPVPTSMMQTIELMVGG